jgi:hypothetical protein
MISLRYDGAAKSIQEQPAPLSRPFVLSSVFGNLPQFLPVFAFELHVGIFRDLAASPELFKSCEVLRKIGGNITSV